METLTMTKEQARRVFLAQQGLWPPYQLAGKTGVLDYIRRVGCIQFDPLDIVGRNPELVLHARVADFRPVIKRERNILEDRFGPVGLVQAIGVKDKFLGHDGSGLLRRIRGVIGLLLVSRRGDFRHWHRGCGCRIQNVQQFNLEDQELVGANLGFFTLGAGRGAARAIG